VVTTEEDEITPGVAEFTLKIPSTDQSYLSALLSIIPMQLLAYHLAKIRGLEIDQPRNLAKSVTVE